MKRATAVPAVIALTIVQLLRQTGAHSWQTIWAEDGRVYGTEALQSGGGDTLFRAYNGYVQVVERAGALALRVAPASRYSTVLAVTAAVITSILVVLVYRWTDGWIARPSLRVAVAAMALIGPGAYYEMTANLANLGWPLVIAAFWAIAARRSSVFDTVVRAVVVAAAALTTTVALLL